MVLHFFTQNNTETAVVYFNFLVKHVNKILINKKIYKQVPDVGNYFLFSFYYLCTMYYRFNNLHTYKKTNN